MSGLTLAAGSHGSATKLACRDSIGPFCSTSTFKCWTWFNCGSTRVDSALGSRLVEPGLIPCVGGFQNQRIAFRAEAAQHRPNLNQ